MRFNCSRQRVPAYSGKRPSMCQQKARISSNPATWSKCSCVYSTPVIAVRLCRRACSCRSGPASTRMVVEGVDTVTEARRRLLRGLEDLQTGQLQPMTGMAVEVPVPRKTMCMRENLFCFS